MKKIIILLLFSMSICSAKKSECTYKNTVVIHPYSLVKSIYADETFRFEMDYIRVFPYGFRAISTLNICKEKDLGLYESWTDDYSFIHYELYSLELHLRMVLEHPRRKLWPYIQIGGALGYFDEHKNSNFLESEQHTKGLYRRFSASAGCEIYLRRFYFYTGLGYATSNTHDTNWFIIPELALGFAF